MRDDTTEIIMLAAIVVVLTAFLALLVMLLWNWLMPDLLGLPTISCIMAFGLQVLCGCLFGGASAVGKGAASR